MSLANSTMGIRWPMPVDGYKTIASSMVKTRSKATACTCSCSHERGNDQTTAANI